MTEQIFISYSKKDSTFANKLADDLKTAGFEIWIDRSIGGGELWRETIEKNLKAAGDVIIVVSPNSMASEWVRHEGSLAYGWGKKLYPILIEKVGVLPPWLEEYQWIDFINTGYKVAFDTLISALTPPNPIQDLLDQQVQAYRQTGELIGEAILRVVEEAHGTLVINDDAQHLIEKSQRVIEERQEREQQLLEEKQAAEQRRITEQVAFNRKLRRRAMILGVAFILAIFAFGLAVSQWNRAEKQAQIARAHQFVAQGQILFEEQPLFGIRLVLEGVKLAPPDIKPLLSDVTEDLFSKGRVLKLNGLVDNIFRSTNGSMAILSYADPDAHSELRRTIDGSFVKTLTDRATRVQFSPNEDGSYFIVSYNEYKNSELRRTSDGKLIHELPPPGDLRFVEFSPDPAANYLFLHFLDEHTEALETATGNPVPLPGTVYKVEFSADQAATYFIVYYSDSFPELRRTSDGKLVHTFTKKIDQVKFSPSPAAEYLLAGNYNGDAELYRTASGDLITTFTKVEFLYSHFSPDPDATYLVIRFGDYAKVYHSKDGQVVDFPNNFYTSVQFSPDPGAAYFIIHYGDGLAELRRSSDTKLISTLSGISTRVEFSPGPESNYIVVRVDEFPFQSTVLRRSDDLTSEIITLDSEGHGPSLQFSQDPESNYFVTTYTGYPNELYRSSDGAWLYQFTDVQDIVFSPDPQAAYLVATHHDKHLELLRTSDGEIVEMAGRVVQMEFIPGSEAIYFIVRYEDGRSELWQGQDKAHLLSELGLGLKGYEVDPTRQRLLVWYTYGSAYLLDLVWLKDMGGNPGAYTADELERFACQRLFVAPFFDESGLGEYLGEDQLLACR